MDIKGKIKIILNREMYFYISFFYVSFKYIFPNNTTFLTYIIMLYGISILIYDILFNRRVFYFKDTIISILMILSFIAPMVLLKRIDYTNIAILIDVIITFLLYFNCFNNVEINDAKKILENVFKVFFIYTFIWAIAAILFYVFKITLSINGCTFGLIDGVRLSFARPSINPTGFMAIAAISASIYLLYNTFVNKKILFVHIILQLIVILLTQSRGSFVTIVAGFVWIVFCHILTNKNAIKYMLYIVVGIIIIGAISIILNKFNKLPFRLFDFDYRDRTNIVIFGILVLLNSNPLFGSSYSGIKIDWPKYYDIAYKAYNNWGPTMFKKFDPICVRGAVHNAYLAVICSTGIFGSIVLFMLLLYTAYIIINFLILINKFKIDIYNLFIPLSFMIITSFILCMSGESMITSITEYQGLLFFVPLSALITIKRTYLDINDK